MKALTFDDIAKENFNFLISDYDFKLIKSHKENSGYKLIYLNSFTGVKITYEYREAYIFIMLYKLINRKMIENPIDIMKDSILYGYGLDDIINLKNPSDLIKPSYQYNSESDYHDSCKGLTLYVSTFANNLKIYASDILDGDFKIFKELDTIVKDRISK
jgi:hypothetical protein